MPLQTETEKLSRQRQLERSYSCPSPTVANIQWGTIKEGIKMEYVHVREMEGATLALVGHTPARPPATRAACRRLLGRDIGGRERARGLGASALGNHSLCGRGGVTVAAQTCWLAELHNMGNVQACLRGARFPDKTKEQTTNRIKCIPTSPMAPAMALVVARPRALGFNSSSSRATDLPPLCLPATAILSRPPAAAVAAAVAEVEAERAAPLC